MNTITAGLIFGGPSHEHEVSLASAWNIRAILGELGMRVVEIGIDHKGSWYRGDGVLEGLLSIARPEFLPGSVKAPAQKVPLPPPCSISDALRNLAIAVPVTHGDFGEDGTLQATLEAHHVGYIGCDLRASVLCYCKDVTKAVLGQQGVPVLPGRTLSAVPRPEESDEIFAILASRDRPTLFVKPAASGSSFGISKAQTTVELQDGVRKALQYSDRVLVEPAIAHTEYVFGVIDSPQGPIVSCGAECVPTRALYDYHDKYIVGNPFLRCPAEVERSLQDKMQNLAAKTFRALGCRDFSRVDFFVEKESGVLVVNEVNTIPGFTGSSVFSKVMNASGWPLVRVFGYLIERALDAKASLQ